MLRWLPLLALLLLACRENPLRQKARDMRQADAGATEAPADPSRGHGCTVEGVQAVVRPHIDEVKACYRQALARKRTLKGRLAVEIDIDPKGAAKFLGVKEDTLGDEAMTQCIFKVLKPLPYPIPAGGKPCAVIYPFDLSAGP